MLRFYFMKSIYILLLLTYFSGAAQIEPSGFSVGFYNLENLFDTIDQADIWDDDRTPNGKYHYNTEVYQTKLENMSRVIRDMHKHNPQYPLYLLGLAELENQNVIEDLISKLPDSLQAWGIIHQDSPDKRGIDVALIYQQNHIQVVDFNLIELRLWNSNSQRIYTRDILEVHLIFQAQEMMVYINHWPSRRGGEKRSRRLRETAAKTLRKRIEFILNQNPDLGILIMGDFNDNPNNSSFKNYLRTGLIGQDSLLVNPFETLYKKGFHSLIYRDQGFLFDQIIFNKSYLDASNKIRYKSSLIFNPKYLTNPNGKYKGYPFRSYGGHRFQGGFSDHYPVIIYFRLINIIE